jgi:CDP-glucose 4,6-dehydratase
MEDLGLAASGSDVQSLVDRRVDPSFWAGKRVLLTGQTGFKGAWAALWLECLGARVSGFALPPVEGANLYSLAAVGRGIDDGFGDLRGRDMVAAAVARADPDIVLHLAAQPLVRRSYADPVETFSSNVTGTVHLLEALRSCSRLKAILVVTTDKVYANDEQGHAYAEEDRLGGHDPYAASKAACEIVVASYAMSFFKAAGVLLATARGGNVIGGGDFSVDRIVPDVFRALSAGVPVRLRNPGATRPWQHVLDCLAGYLLYLESLADGCVMPAALNFGPAPQAPISVAALVTHMQGALGAVSGWEQDTGDHPREMATLALSSAKARVALGWRDRLPGEAAIRSTASWYKAYRNGADMRAFTLRQIEDYSRL